MKASRSVAARQDFLLRQGDLFAEADSPLPQLMPRLSAVCLQRIDSSSNMFRYYSLRLEQNLFGDWAMVREYGRIGVGGRRRSDCFTDRAEALAALRRQQGVKERRGYILVADAAL